MKDRKHIPTNAAPREWIAQAMGQVRAERRRRKLHQKQLAEMVGLTQHAISALERDPFSVKAHRLFHLCDALGLEIVVQPRRIENLTMKEAT